MKKFFNTLTAVALAVALSSALTACGDDDDNKDEPTPDVTVKEAVIDLKFCVNQEMLNAYDISVRSASGEALSFSAQPEDVTFDLGTVESLYVVQVTGTSRTLPFTQAMSISFSLKADYVAPEVINFVYGEYSTGVITYSDDTQRVYQKGSPSRSNGVKADKLADYAQLLNKRYALLKVTLEADDLDIDHD